VEDLVQPRFNAAKAEDNWLIPQRWNQGCYDAIHLSCGVVQFCQVTRAESHTCNAKYAVQMLDQLEKVKYKISKIEIVVVLPSDANHEEFKLKPEGSWGKFKQKVNLNDCLIYGLCRT